MNFQIRTYVPYRKKTGFIPSGITVTVGPDNVVTVKGPKGELKQAIDRDIKVEVKEDHIEFHVRLIRSVTVHCMVCIVLYLSNMVKGVAEGYKRQLELIGVGFKASNQGNLLDLALGYSHNIIFEIPRN